MSFKDPWILLLLPVVLAGVVFLRRRQRPAGVRFSNTGLVSELKATWRSRLSRLPYFCRLFALAIFIIALAGPRTILDETKYKVEGIDIILAIDASPSLAAEDFMLQGKRYNRLEVIKNVVEEFIDARKYDRIGIVAFAGRAYTVSPLTQDYLWLKANLRRIELGLIEDGTAIGSAIMSSVLRLKDGKAKSQVIILLTDGVNNAGRVDPLTAANAAKIEGLRVYAIGAGTKGYVNIPVGRDIWGNVVYQKVRTDVDEEILKEIARITGGKYFRATDTQSLRQIYHDIDHMEKTELQVTGYREYHELFVYFLAAGLALLAAEVLLSRTVLMRIP